MNQSYIDFLPAQHGDAMIIHCVKGDNRGTIVVDGGPYTNARLNRFVKVVEDFNPVDLMILTHHDSDHITGLLHYIKIHHTDSPFPVHEVWADCAKHIDFYRSHELSANQAGKLADYLDSLQSDNKLIWRSDIESNCGNIEFPFASLEIIGPSPATYRKFMEEYGEKVPDTAASTPMGPNVNSDINIPCNELAARAKVQPNPNDYQQLTNMASIAFILRCDGLNFLMLADSFPREITDCLIQRGYSQQNKLKVDFVKIAHHGSRNNTDNDLLDIIDCNNFLISTNGGTGRSRHPQRETIANILCHPERDYDRTVNLFFNYPLDLIQRYDHVIFNQALDADLNFKIHEPVTNDSDTPEYRISAS